MAAISLTLAITADQPANQGLDSTKAGNMPSMANNW